MIETGLRDRVVIVTGAAAGIGRATAMRFAQEGALVAAWDVKADGSELLLRELEAAGGRALFHAVNVADAEAVEAAAREVADRWGRIDVLVNNAGIVRDAQLVKVKDGELAGRMSDEAWEAGDRCQPHAASSTAPARWRPT